MKPIKGKNVKKIKGLDYVQIVKIIIRIVFLVQICISIYNKEYRNIAPCVIGIIATLIINLLENTKKAYAPKMLRIGMLILIFITLYMGETLKFYDNIKYFDKGIHVFSGILFVYLGVYITCLLNREDTNNNIDKYYIVLSIISFSIAIATLWEITEFTFDRLINENMQRWKEGYEFALIDTMQDLIAETIGAFIGGGIYLYCVKKYKDKYLLRFFK